MGDLQTALTQAAAHSGEDTVEVAAMGFQAPGGFSYNSPDAVHIVGDGGVAFGDEGATLADSTANPTGQTTLRVLGTSASTVTGIDVRTPEGTGNGNIGVETRGTLNDVVVEGHDNPSMDGIGVLLDDGGAITHSVVSMSTSSGSEGVVFNGTPTSASDSRVEASGALEMGMTGAPTGSASRLSVISSGLHAGVLRGSLDIEDSTFDTSTDSLFVHQGLLVNAAAANASLTANHVTMIGSSGSDAVAFQSLAANGHHAELSVRNSVATLYPISIKRSAAAGSTANVTTGYSDYGGTPNMDTGPGSITETNHLNGAPGFLSASDPHLRSDSPLIDAGDPAALAAGESSTDVSGQPRIVDGDGNCSARRDIGAFEFQPGPRAPRAAASAAPTTALTGQPVAFDSAGSCDADGDALTYSWTFDDGGGAPGASVQRTFSTPGLHFGTVTVSDPSGRSAAATAAVRVAFPPFNGVTIASGKFRASKKGAVKLKLTCAGGTAGLCAGTLSLDGRRASFSIPPGTTRSVTVKLPKSKLKTLRKKKKQKLTATAVAHDVNGTGRTSSAKLTLLAPR